MANAGDRDVFVRALGGDRRARIEIFKKFVKGSARVRKYGESSADPNEFLHDCFKNLLVTGHAWNNQTNLAEWVESVAAWTALQNRRTIEMNRESGRERIRMCAEIEGEDAQSLRSYSPPSTASEASLPMRILDLQDEPQKTIFRKLAIENSTWEDAAASSQRPVNACGPIFARALNRASRLFGAPPPLDDDLEPVFSRAADDPQKAEGRAISIQLDPLFYVTTPELQRTGLNTSHDARILTLWEFSTSPQPPAKLQEHLDRCNYCAALFRSLILLRRALNCVGHDPGNDFWLCPGAFTLANPPSEPHDVLDRHLGDCPFCAKEDAVLPSTQRLASASGETAEAAATGGKAKWIAAACLVLVLAGYGGFRYYTARSGPSSRESARQGSEPPVPTVGVDPRYRDLVQSVELDDAGLMRSVLPANRPAMRVALNQFALGNVTQALAFSSDVAAKSKDPGAETLYAMCLYRTILMTDAYRKMLKAEAMEPRDSLRCWITLQFALMVGDKKAIQQELGHLAEDPRYAARAKVIEEGVRLRG